MGAEFYLIRLAYCLYRLSVKLHHQAGPDQVLNYSRSFSSSPLINHERQRLPQLSELAVDINSVPPMSSEPERVFSSAKHTITDQRCSLNIDSIEFLECLKSWFRTGMFVEEDLYCAIERTGDIVGTVEEALGNK